VIGFPVGAIGSKFGIQFRAMAIFAIVMKMEDDKARMVMFNLSEFELVHGILLSQAVLFQNPSNPSLKMLSAGQ
jgi:hypothetical protein